MTTNHDVEDQEDHADDETVLIDPRRLNVTEDRATAHYDEGEYEALEADIRRRGIQEPLQVLDVDGVLVITDGFNRSQIALKLGIKEVPCRIRKGTERDALLDNLGANVRRGKNKAGEMAVVVVKLQRDHGASLEEIEQSTGLSRAYLKRLLALSSATPTVLMALDSGHLSIGAAMEIARLGDNDAQNRVMQMAQNLGWNVDYTRQIVDATLEELKKPVAERVAIENVQPRGVACEFCEQLFQSYQLLGLMVCKPCYGLGLALVREAKGPVATPPVAHNAGEGA